MRRHKPPRRAATTQRTCNTLARWRRGLGRILRPLRHDRTASPQLQLAKRMAAGVIGGTLCLLGIAMLVLPGPAVVVLPLGLSVLATQFVWARRMLRRARLFAGGLSTGWPRQT